MHGRRAEAVGALALPEDRPFSIGAGPDGRHAFQGLLDNIRWYAATDVMRPTNTPLGLVEPARLEAIRRTDAAGP